MVVFEIIAEACCSFLFVPAVEAVREDLKVKSQETKFVSINNNCSIDGCNAMRYEESIYCLRHKPSKESKEETQPEENWWEDQKE
ncbi:MAG: hypothetical protein ACJZ4M_01185 [Candidatus Thalassarchaeaceae archaeon]|tara:strand:- start:374 stop:628 length:255 start_codon:yes stop_codon:yes gene_type:complete